MRQYLAVIPFLALIACDGPIAALPPGPAIPPATQDTCNANQYAHLIGQDATALERILLMGQVRVIRPGDAVTMDFRPERINFMIEPDNRIASISCN